MIWPVRTNAGFLVEALDHPDFAAGNVDTGLIAREGDALMPPALPSEEALIDAAAALVADVPIAGFRLNAPTRREGRFLVGGEAVTIDFTDAAPGDVDEPLDSVLVTEGGQTWEVAPWRALGATGAAAGDGAILSPMPGRVIAVEVAAGDSVTKGQKLVTLEAMKMEHSLVAPFDGTIAELTAIAGGQVSEGTLLVKVERADI